MLEFYCVVFNKSLRLKLIFLKITNHLFHSTTHTVSSSYPCPGNHSNCTALPLTHGEMVRLDEGRFPALELNNRRLSVKNSFCRKNGIYTRSVPNNQPRCSADEHGASISFMHKFHFLNILLTQFSLLIQCYISVTYDRDRN